jgi:hypothetical protein
LSDAAEVERELSETPTRTREQRSSPHSDADAPLPSKVPYVPLGIRGDHLFLMDAGGIFCALRRRDLTRPVLITLFGASGESSIFHLYPKWHKDTKTGEWVPTVSSSSFNYCLAIKDLVHRCRDAGHFDPESHLRGPFVWRGRDGKGVLQPVLHFGDHLIVGGKRQKLNKLGGYGYVRETSLPPLLSTSVLRSEAPGQWLIQQFGCWRWRYQRLAPTLLTGSVAAAVLNESLPVRPVLAVGGDVHWGKQELLRVIQRVLGPFLLVAHEANEQHIAEMVGWRSLPVLIDPPLAASAISARYMRRPAWMAETARMRPYDGVRFCTDQTAQTLGLREGPSFLELDLSGRPYHHFATIGARDCAERRPLLIRRMVDQLRRLTEDVYPSWRHLLAVQEGETGLVRTIAMQLAAAWVLQRDDVPHEGDFEALQPELDLLMGSEHEWRTPAWLQVLDCVRSVPTSVSPPYGTATLLDKIGVAAGAVVIGETPMLDEGRWTEAQAIDHARRDPEAGRAQQLIGQFGLKVLEDLPDGLKTEDNSGGYRCLAIAISAPARDTQLERMSSWERLNRQGMSIRTLLQAPRARDLRSTMYFAMLGSRHCLVVPLELVTGGLAVADADGVADAWRRAGET